MNPRKTHPHGASLALACLIALFAASPASANLRLVFETDVSGNPTTGTFSGPGTPDANIVSGTSGHSIIGAGTGTMIGVEIVDNSTAQNFSPDIMTMDTTFDFGGGTADLGFQPAGGHFKGWSISNLVGASSISITSVFSDPIHSRDETRLDGFPWGFHAGLLNEGTGFTPQDFDVTYTIGGLQYGTAGVLASFPTTPIPDSTPHASTGWDNATTQNTLVFNSADGWLDRTGSGGSLNNLLVRGYDDENTGFDRTDAQQFYAQTFTMTIRPLAAATFASNAQFIFSYDGDRRLELDPLLIPEPTRVALLAFFIALLSFRRRR